MKCVICKHGETRRDKASITLDRGETTLVIRGVPAQVCQDCGEQYLDEETTAQLLDAAEEAARSGVQVTIREFAAA